MSVATDRDGFRINPLSSGASIDEKRTKSRKKIITLGGEQLESIRMNRLLDGGI